MSENLALLRTLYEGMARGDLRGPEGLISPDFVFEPIWDGRVRYTGADAFRAQMREFLAQWEDFRIEAKEFEDRGDVVLVTERQNAVGKRSGVEIEKAFVSVWRFRDGVAVSGRWYDDRAEALAAIEAD
jgi:ketosteroid isomerase-like protein